MAGSSFRVLIDMDEVLVDFVGGVCKLWEVPLDNLYHHWPRGTWDIKVPLAKYLGKEEMTDDEFWAPINGNVLFWTGLKPYRWMVNLIQLVESYTDDWHIVSAPSKCISSYTGKVKWLRNRFGPSFTNFALTPHKEIFAKKGVLLIDDKQENVNKFIAHGGRAVLFPSYYNMNHMFLSNPLLLVEDGLKRMKDNCLELWKDPPRY